jgi:hypothetical protein
VGATARRAEQRGADRDRQARSRRDPESYRAEFVLARQKVIEVLLASGASSAGVADQLVDMATFHLRDDYLARLATGVAQLTLKDLHPFVERELASDGEVFGAFGDRAAVEAALTAGALP